MLKLALQRVVIFVLSITWLTNQVSAQPESATVSERGTSTSGSQWLIEKPNQWNGTLLLWSHGWWPSLREPDDAPSGLRQRLLDDGYALAGSTYASAGWAVAEAVPDQLDVVDQFAARFGVPRRTIAWGNSMGGLVTSVLAERHADRIDAAMPICSSSGGALGMLNAGLDGAFAFVTLVAMDAGIELVGVVDDRANGVRVRMALENALDNPAGLGRVALASVLGGLPGWTDSTSAKPDDDDYEAQAAQMAASFLMGVFLPRAEQEARAGGHVSWNTGIDYRDQLERSGRRTLVEHLYAQANLDLDADLDRLNGAPRIPVNRSAAAYMMLNFTPSGHIGVPVLNLQTVGDGVTSPSLQRGYIESIAAAGDAEFAAAAWNDRAGHCTSSPGEILAGLQALEARVESGRWSVSPAELNRAARAAGEASPTFVEHTPAPMMRPCANRIDACPSYPFTD